MLGKLKKLSSTSDVSKKDKEKKDKSSKDKGNEKPKIPKQTLPGVIKQLEEKDPALTIIHLPKSSLNESNISSICKLLAENQTATYLNIANNQIRDKGAKWIAFVIKKNSIIVDLDIGFNSLTPDGVKFLLDAVKKNITLLRFTTREFPQQGSFATDELCPRIAKAAAPIQKYIDDNKNIANALRRKSTILEVVDREITAIPSIVASLQHLTVLNLSNNQIEDISCIYKFATLTELNLSNNLISTITNDVGKLFNLEKLIINNNKIRYLPTKIASLPNLQHVDLRNNLIFGLECIPSRRLGKSLSLRILKLSGNPIIAAQSFIPSFILESDAEPLIDYLKAINSTNVHNCRAKIIVIGDRKTGKSSLLKSLMTTGTHKAVSDEGTISSEFDANSKGEISIHKWIAETKKILNSSRRTKSNTSEEKMLLVKKNSKKMDLGLVEMRSVEKKKSIRNISSNDEFQATFIEFCCWDFQDVNFCAQQFFYSDDAIFIVVFSLQECNFSTLESNIASIRSFGGKNPIVFVVGTHFEGIANDKVTAMFRQINKKFPIVRKFFATNLNGAGIKQLKGSLIAQALVLPDFGKKISQKYLYLEECFHDQVFNNTSLLDLSDVSKIANECQLDVAEVPAALTFLAKVGSIVYINDPKSGLTDKVFLDPIWLASIFDRFSTLNSKDAKIFESKLHTLWGDDKKYPLEIRNTLVTLLERFEIISPMIASKEEEKFWIIPQLLSDTIPSIVTDLPPDYERNVWRRIVHFKYLPDSFIPRLITRMLRNIGGNMLYWKTGMVWIHDNKQCSVLSYNPADVEVYLEVPATNVGSNLLCDIMTNLLAACGDIKKTILVPCNDCIVNHGKRVGDSYHFKFLELEKTAGEGVSYISCYYNTLFPQPILIESLAPDITLKTIEHLKFDYSALELFEVVGEGGFGSVYRASLNGEIVAAKLLKIKMDNDQEEESENENNPFAEFRQEVLLMAGLKNQYLVQLKGISFKPLTVITDYCGAGDLYHLCNDVAREKPVSMGFILCAAIDIARGMSFLHSASPPIVHRDLKSPNILLTMKDDTFDESLYIFPPESEKVPDDNLVRPIIAKVADFGLSTRSSLPSEGRLVDNPLWLAPEVIKNLPYSTKADVYSFGIILWELHTCKVPFEEFNIRFLFQLEDKIVGGLRPTLPENILPRMKQLMVDCWDQDPEKRPDFQEIVNVILVAQQDIHFVDPSHKFEYDEDTASTSTSTGVVIRKFVIDERELDETDLLSQETPSQISTQTREDNSDDEPSVIYNLKKKKSKSGIEFKKKKSRRIPESTAERSERRRERREGREGREGREKRGKSQKRRRDVKKDPDAIE